MLIFDIETGPLPDDKLEALLPEFDESEFQPSKFDESSVKLGNLKDTAKIAEKVAEARRAHEARQSQLPALLEEARKTHFCQAKDRAALSATTGRVLAIGVYNPASSAAAIIDGDESDVLSSFWAKVEKCAADGRKLIGHNIFGFDLPFLVRRSWMHDVDIPKSLLFSGRYPNDRVFCDIMQVWGCGQFRDFISLDGLSKIFGVGAKPEGIDGSDFARLWFGSAEDREREKEYLINDLQLTAAVARRMQIL